MNVSQTLQQAIAALNEGDRGRARQLLAQVLQADPCNESAWLWLVRAVDDPAHARECVERVLRINPGNEEARQMLETIRHRESRTTNEHRDKTRAVKRTSVPRASRTRADRTEKKGGLGAAGWGCLIIILLAVLGTCLGDQSSSSPTPTVNSYEKQAAIRTVQEYGAWEGLKVIDGIGMGLTFVENDGYSVEVSGWNARKESNRWVVEFVFYVDGDRETARWWYVPDSGLVIPKNEWAETFMAY